MLFSVTTADTLKEQRDLMEFVNEVLPEVSSGDAPSRPSSADPTEAADDDDLMEDLPKHTKYNLADTLRRRWAQHIREMLSASTASPLPASGSGGTVCIKQYDFEN